MIEHRGARRRPKSALPSFRCRPRAIAQAVAVALAAISVGAPSTVPAADRTLVNAGFTWDNPFAWSPVGEPWLGENVYIPTGTITYAPSTLFSGDTFASMVVGSSAEPVTCGFLAGASVGRNCFGVSLGGRLDPVRVDYPALNFAAVLEMADVPGRTLRIDRLVVGGPGESGSGALVLRGGRVQVNGDAQVGTAFNQAGYVLLAAGAGAPELSVGGSLILGYQGEGLLIQEAGTTQVGASLIVGDELMSSGVRLSGGSFTVAGDAVIGHHPGGSRNGGAGAFQHEGGSFIVGGNLVLGRSLAGPGAGNAVGAYRITDGATLSVGGSIVLGSETDRVGWGRLQLAGGSVATTADLVVRNGWDGSAISVGLPIPNLLFIEGSARVSVGRDLVIGDPGDAAVTAEAILRGSHVTTVGRDLVLGRGDLGNGLLTFESGSLTVVRDSIVGSEGAGTLSFAGTGTFSTAGQLVLGSLAGSRGTLELAGAAASSNFSVGGVLVVGDAGQGTFLHQRSGQTALPGGLIVGYSAGGAGMVDVTGAGGLTIGSGLVIGARGAGTLTHGSTGALDVRGLTVIGQHPGSSGLLKLDAGGGSFAGGLVIGDFGTGALDQGRSGLLVIDGSVSIGVSPGSNGSWLMRSGASALVLGGVTVGGAGKGRVTMRDSVVLGNLVVGALPGSDASAVVHGLESGTRQDLVIGDLGEAAQLSVQATRMVVGGNAIVGRGAAGAGLLRVDAVDGDGPALLEVGGRLIVGDAGRGRVYVPRIPGGPVGSIAVTGEVVLGSLAGSEGRIEFDPWFESTPATGGLVSGGPIRIGVGGMGVAELSTGRHTVGGVTLAEQPGSFGELTMVGTGSLTVQGDLSLSGQGTASVLQDGFDVSVRSVRPGVGGNLMLGAATGSRQYQLKTGGLDVEGTVSVAHGSFVATGGALRAMHLDVGANGTVTLDRSLSLGGTPGSDHHASGRVIVGANSRLEVPNLTIRAGGEYQGSPTGQLQTSAIDMSGGAVFGVLQNTGIFRYSGGSFLAGAGLRNEGSVDLQADLVLGFLDNPGTFAIPSGRAVTVGGPGGGTGVIQNSGWLMNEGTLQASGLAVTAGGTMQQNAGTASFGAGGLRVGSTGPTFANVFVTGGTVTSSGPIEVGSTGPAGVNIASAEVALQGVDASLRIGAQGVASMRNAAFWRIDGDALDVQVDAGGVLAMSGAGLGVGRIRVDGSLHVLGRVTREGRGLAETTVQVGPGGLLLFDVPPPAGFDNGVPFTPNIVNEGTWRKVGAGSERSLLSGRVTQNGTLDVEDSALVLSGGGSASGSTHVWTTGRMDLRGKPSVPQTTYEWGGSFVNDGAVLVTGDGAATTQTTFTSIGTHGGSFTLARGGTLVVAGGTQTFAGGTSGISVQGGSLEFAGGTSTFQAGSRLAATSGLPSSSVMRFSGGSVRMDAGSAIVLPERFALEGTDLALSTGGAHSYGRDILLSAGALGGSDAFTQTAGRFDWTGGALYGSGVVTLEAPVTLAIGGTADKRLDRTLRAQGAAQWSGGNVSGSGVLELATGSTFVGTVAGAFAPRLETRGSFLSQVDLGTATYLGRVDALGATITVDRGGMKLAGGGSSDAPFEVRAGASIEFAGGGREFVFDGAGARLFGGGMASFVDGRTVFRNGATFGPLGSERIAGGTLELGAGSRYVFNPTLTIESGAVLVSTGLGAFTLPATTMLQSGTLGGSDDRVLAAGSTLSWLGGTLGGPGATSIAAGALLDMPGSGARTLESPLAIGGRAAWSGGSIAGSTTIQNLAGGTFDVSGGSTLGPSLANAGLLRVTNGAATTTFLGALRNDGSMRIESGALQLNGAFQNLVAGTLAGGTYFVAGAFRHSGANITTVAADVTLSGPAASFRSVAGTELLDSFASVAAGARLEITDGRNLAFANGRTITVDGRFEVGAGSLLTAGPGNLTGGGVIELKPGAQMLWTAAFLIGANAVLRVDAGATLTLQDVTSNHDHYGRTIANQGTIRWLSGDVRGGESGGVTSRIVNAGLWQDEGTVTKNISSFNSPLPHTFENSGTYSKTGSGTTRFSNQALVNGGRFDLHAGAVELHSGGRNAGTIDIAAGSAMMLAGGTFEFVSGGRTTGAGVWRLGGGTLAMNGSVSVSNLLLANGSVTGTHSVDGQVTWQQTNFSTPGTTTIASGAMLIVQDGSSNHDHFGRTIVNQGTIRWMSGDVRGGESGGVASRIVNAGLWRDEIAAAQNLSSFNTASPLVFANTGTYVKSLASGATTPTTTNFGGFRMDNIGTVEVAAGTLNLGRGVEQVVGSRLTGGTWIAGPDALILIPGISPLTINEGRVHLRGPNSRMSGISTLADNRGEFRISEGRNFTTVGNLVNSGLIFAGAGSRLTVNGTFTSTGTLGGSGELQVGLLSAAGPIAPGSSPGRMRVDGRLAMQGSASLDIEIAGPLAGVGYDTLEVTGNATIAGRLRVDVLAGFPTMATTSFAILTAANVAGEFAGLADGARFNASGLGGSFVIDYTPTGIYLTDYIAPVPVPEPATWALMGIGALLVGARAARCRPERSSSCPGFMEDCPTVSTG